MAEFIPYLDQELDFMQAQKALADNKETYLASRPYLDPVKWNRAYADLMSRGITGVTLNNGSYEIQHNGLDFTDPEGYYGDVAHYIQSTLAGVTPRQKEEPKKLPIFNSEEFENDFGKHVTTRYYGGVKATADAEWNLLDKPDKYGIRKTDERKARLIDALKSYKDSLLNRDNEYSFEGSPFKDMNDVRARLDAAIKALESPKPDDDKKALNALGWTQDKWLKTGENEPYRDTGMTALEARNAEAAALQKQEQQKIQAQKQAAYNSQYKKYRFIDATKFNGTPPTGENVLGELNTYSSLGKLNGDQMSRLVGAFKFAEKNNALSPLSKEELQAFGSFQGADRLRKIEGLKGFYWDPVGKRIVQPFMDRNAGVPGFQDLVNQKLKEKQQNTPISKEGWTSADTADVVSMIGDLVSLGGLWANIGGTATSLTADLYSDISRGKDLGSILNGVIANVGWGLAGLLPGGKSTKLISRTARLIPKAIVAAQSAGIILDKEIQDSAMKFTTLEGLKTVSSKDLENLKYLFHAVTGGTNIAKSHVRAKNYREQLNKQKVQTKEGTKNLSNKDIKEINKAGRKGGQKAAEELFEKKTGQKAAEGQFKFSENGKSRFNPTRYSSTLNRFFGNDQYLKGEQTTDMRAMSQILQKDKELPWYNWNKGYAPFELTPFRIKNSSNKQKKPQKQSNNQQEQSNSQQQQSTNQQQLNQQQFTNSNKQQATPYSNRGARKEYLNTIKKHKFSNNQTQEGDFDFKLGNGDQVGFNVKKNSDGSFTISTSNIGSKVENSKQTGSSQRVEASKVKERFAKQIEQITKNSNNTTKHKEMARVIRELKAKGWLKQGGQINNIDTIIENFLKEQ